MSNLIKNLPPLPSSFALAFDETRDEATLADWVYVARRHIFNLIDPITETILPEFFEQLAEYVFERTGERLPDSFIISYSQHIVHQLFQLKAHIDIIDLLCLGKLDVINADVPSDTDRKWIVTSSLKKITLEVFLRKFLAGILIQSHIENLFMDFDVEREIVEDKSFFLDFGDRPLSEDELRTMRQHHLIHKVEVMLDDLSLEQLILMYKQYSQMEA